MIKKKLIPDEKNHKIVRVIVLNSNAELCLKIYFLLNAIE